MFPKEQNKFSCKSQGTRSKMQHQTPSGMSAEDSLRAASHNNGETGRDHTYNDPNTPYYCLTLYPASSSSPQIHPSILTNPQGSHYTHTNLPSSIESPEYLAHRLLVEFGKTRTNYNSLVPRIIEVMRLFRDYGPSRCPVPVVSNLEELLNDEALNRIEHKYPNSLDAGFLVLCTERRALRSGGGGKYYFIDTSGRLVGCHKSDLSVHADKGVLCGPVLLKNLIFVFIMRGTFGLDPRCKSSNPQRLLEYYENLAKEGKAMDVQRLVRVWSMEIFPETPYDGGFPHCSLLWVKRMHVGAHLIKWKRSQWHSNQLRVQDYYVQGNVQQDLNISTASPIQQQLPVNQQICNYYGSYTGPNVTDDMQEHQFNTSDVPEMKDYYVSGYRKCGTIKRRRLTEEETSFYNNSDATFLPQTDSQLDHSHHGNLPTSCGSTLFGSDARYVETFGPFSASRPETPRSLSCSALNVPSSPDHIDSAATISLFHSTPRQNTDPSTPNFNDDNIIDFWRLPITSDSSSASKSATPQMPTILTSGFSNAEDFYPASFSTAASVPCELRRNGNSVKDTHARSQGSAKQMFQTSLPSEIQALQSAYTAFDKFFGHHEAAQLKELCHQTIIKLDDRSLAIAAQLMLQRVIDAELRDLSDLRTKLIEKVYDSSEISELKAFLKVLLGIYSQQLKLIESKLLVSTAEDISLQTPEQSRDNKNYEEIARWRSLETSSDYKTIDQRSSVKLDKETLINLDDNVWKVTEGRKDILNDFKVVPSTKQQFYVDQSKMTPTSMKNNATAYYKSPLSSPQCMASTPHPLRACEAGISLYKDTSLENCILDRNLYAQTFTNASLTCNEHQTSYLESDQPISTFQTQTNYYGSEDTFDVSSTLNDYCDKIFKHAMNRIDLTPSHIRSLRSAIRPPAQGITLLEQVQHISSYDEASTPQFHSAKLPYAVRQYSDDTKKESLYEDQKSEDVCDDVDVRQGQAINPSALRKQ